MYGIGSCLSGVGNMKLINTPEVDFPKDFEIYDPKTDNKQKLVPNGLSGNKVIEYLAIPRHAGTFTIPPVEFSYFDLKTESYKTLKTESYTVNVAKGEGSSEQVVADFTNKEDLKVIGTDIRFIKTGEARFAPKGHFFAGSLDDFWENVCTLDAEFEKQRKQLAAENKRLRYVARMENGSCSIGLQAVDSRHPFYELEGSNNIIMISTERYHDYPMIIQGYGAGADVTAAGVFADIISIANIR